MPTSDCQQCRRDGRCGQRLAKYSRFACVWKAQSGGGVVLKQGSLGISPGEFRVFFWWHIMGSNYQSVLEFVISLAGDT